MNQIKKDNKNPRVPFAASAIGLFFSPYVPHHEATFCSKRTMFSMDTFQWNLHSSKTNRYTFNFPKSIRGGAHFLAQ